MSEIFRSRDCTVLFFGDRQTVTVDEAMVTGGWPGAQGVRWVNAPPGVDDRIVTYSNGLYGGFLIYGSDEEGDRFTAMTRQQPYWRYATMFSGGCLIATSSYEKYTYASRLAGPLVPLVYLPNDILYFSLRGLWTREDELSLSANPLAPAFFTGFVSQIPKASNGYFMGIQTSL
jgi:hypothetical protein